LLDAFLRNAFTLGETYEGIRRTFHGGEKVRPGGAPSQSSGTHLALVNRHTNDWPRPTVPCLFTPANICPEVIIFTHQPFARAKTVVHDL
jgi:hypothetical protein